MQYGLCTEPFGFCDGRGKGFTMIVTVRNNAYFQSTPLRALYPMPHQVFSTRWIVIQHDLLPELRDQVGPLTPKLKKIIHTLEWVRIEEFTQASWCGFGRPPHERAWLANAFVAKSVLGLTTTTAQIERLGIDRALRRICGFPLCRKLPSEATFSRALAVC